MPDYLLIGRQGVGRQDWLMDVEKVGSTSVKCMDE